LSQKRRIVLVEDEQAGERSVAPTLARSFPDVDLCGVRDADEALRVLDDAHSRLLIADVQAHAFDAIALAASERKRPPAVPVIAMSTAPFRVWRERASALGAAAWLEKPLQHDRLVGLVERLLVAPSGFNGEIAVDGLPELVQLLCMANTSGALHIDHGAERGTIWFERGAIVHALIGRAAGVRSFPNAEMDRRGVRAGPASTGEGAFNQAACDAALARGRALDGRGRKRSGDARRRGCLGR
jgi:CheY-like chemotaxis protein